MALNNKVPLVPREANPQSCSGQFKVTGFWSKEKLRQQKKSPNDAKNFRGKSNLSARNVSNKTIEALMDGVPEKFKNFAT